MVHSVCRAALLFALTGIFLQGCGYGAADSKDLKPRDGEIVGVLVKENGKADPNSTIELYAKDGEAAISSYTGIDSDGRFGVFPPADGLYSIVGSVGDLDKVILQDIAFTAGVGQNIGTLQTVKVGGLALTVKVPDGYTADGVAFQLLGYAAAGTTIEEGAGLVESGIPAGTYKLRLSKEGLQTLTVDPVTIESGDPTVLQDITLSE